MALDRENQLIDVTGSYLHDLVSQQSWYKENANTATTIGGFLLTLATTLGAQPISDDPKVAIGILILGFLGTILGVKFTRNGVSKSQMAKIEEARAQVIDNAPRVEPIIFPFSVSEDVGTQLALPFPELER